MATPMDNGYVMVADRHLKFVEDHPNGLIETELVTFTGSFVVIAARVWKDRANADADKRPDGTGLASMPIPGPTSFTKNSEVENAETSALGRALAMIGYHAKESMASKEEIDSKSGGEKTRVSKKSGEELASNKQLGAIRGIASNLGMSDEELREFTKKETGKFNSRQLTKEDASKMIDLLKAREAAGGGELADEEAA